MKQPREIEIQESILRGLEKLEIYPFSVFFTDALDLNDSILSITFYIQEDLDELLKILNYKNQCDKSGYITEVEVYTKSPYEKIFKKTKKVVEKMCFFWL